VERRHEAGSRLKWANSRGWAGRRWPALRTWLAKKPLPTPTNRLAPIAVILRTPDGDYAVTFQRVIPPVFQQPLRIEDEKPRFWLNVKGRKDLTLFVVELLGNIDEQQQLGVEHSRCPATTNRRPSAHLESGIKKHD